MGCTSLSTLLIVATMFLLSLLGAWVCFKILKSSARIAKAGAGYQVGGALAGALVTLLFLGWLFNLISSGESAGRADHWTIIGVAKKADAIKHDGIVVKQVPPTPAVPTDLNGDFRLDVVVPKGVWPEISLESEGYYPKTPVRITPQNAIVEASRQEITLKNDIDLPPVRE